jgi:hypothetical protein
LCKRLNYRKISAVDDGKIQNIFDGQLFKDLVGRPIMWNEEQAPGACTYFDQQTDVALGLGTDGIPPYKRSRLDV